MAFLDSLLYWLLFAIIISVILFGIFSYFLYQRPNIESSIESTTETNIESDSNKIEVQYDRRRIIWIFAACAIFAIMMTSGYNAYSTANTN